MRQGGNSFHWFNTFSVDQSRKTFRQVFNVKEKQNIEQVDEILEPQIITTLCF